MRKFARESRRDVRGVSAGALHALTRYDWPGNVRELENVIHRAVVLAAGPVVHLQLPLREACDEFERQYVLRTLEGTQWNVSRTARQLGVHRNTVLAKLATWAPTLTATTTVGASLAPRRAGQRRQRTLLAGREELDEERDGEHDVAGDPGDRNGEERGDGEGEEPAYFRLTHFTRRHPSTRNGRETAARGRPLAQSSSEKRDAAPPPSYGEVPPRF